MADPPSSLSPTKMHTGTSKKRPRRHLRASQQQSSLRPTITPWRDCQELITVGQCLCTAARFVEPTSRQDDVKDVQEALQRVHVWKARSKSLPHAVETAAALAELLLSQHDCSERAVWSSQVPRLALAAALVRGINGLADALQQHQAYASSIMVLCQQLNIPTWLVDVRHEATHNQLPSWPVLTMAAQQLLQYLEQAYFVPLADREQEYADCVQSMLQSYRELALRVVLSGDAPPKPPTVINSGKGPMHRIYDETESSSSSDDDDETNTLSLASHRILGTNLNRFALLEPPAMAKKSKQSVQSEKTNATTRKQHKNNRYSLKRIARNHFTQVSGLPYSTLQQLLAIQLTGTTNGVSLLVPESRTRDTTSLQHLYSPLVRICATAIPPLLPLLLTGLVDAIADVSSIELTTTVCAWLRYLLSASFFARLDGSIVNCHDSDFAPWSVLQRWNVPLHALCQRLSHHLQKLPETSTGSKPVEALLNALTLLAGAVPESNGDETNTVHSLSQPTSDNSRAAPRTAMSLDDMEAMLADSVTVEKAAKSANGQRDSIHGENDGSTNGQRPTWALCPNWEPCDFGTMPGDSVSFGL